MDPLKIIAYSYADNIIVKYDSKIAFRIKRDEKEWFQPMTLQEFENILKFEREEPKEEKFFLDLNAPSLLEKKIEKITLRLIEKKEKQINRAKKYNVISEIIEEPDVDDNLNQNQSDQEKLNEDGLCIRLNVIFVSEDEKNILAKRIFYVPPNKRNIHISMYMSDESLQPVLEMLSGNMKAEAELAVRNLVEKKPMHTRLFEKIKSYFI